MKTTENLLTAKMRTPRIGIEPILRKRLLNIFEGYDYKKLTVISAPTGYGKTVLISQFEATIDYSVVWYQLDKFDNDLTLFVRYFIATISKCIPHFGLHALEFINKEEDISKHIHFLVILLANELEARINKGLVCIFDDYHSINEVLIHQFIEELLEYIPNKVHFIISSRHVLPINTARIKTHGLLNEITSEHLKFNTEEIQIFFANNKNKDISRELIEKAASETDGWAVALSLFKTSYVTANGYNKNFQKTHWKNREEVYNYLAQEVLYKLPKELQSFLVDTSILDILNPHICNKILERNDSKKTLQTLLNMNIFLFKLDDEDDSYKYHHLFRDYLQNRLGDKKALLFDKAGQYYMNNNNYEQAIECFINSNSYNKAIIAIEKTGIKMIKSKKWQTLNRWIENISQEYICDSPWFNLLKGVIYSYKGIRNEAIIQIDIALEKFILDGNNEGILNARLQKSSMLRRAGLLNESLKILNEILPIVNNLPISEWYDVILEKVNILLWNGCLNETIATLKQGIECAYQEENQFLIAYFMEHLGATYYVTGDYFKAIEYYKSSNERYMSVYNTLTEVEKERYSQRTTHASIYRDWGELDKAFSLINEEIEIKERLGLIDDLPRAYHQLAIIYNDMGRKQDAGNYFQKADDMYRILNRKDFQWSWHLALYSKILVDNGKIDDGKKYMDEAIENAKNNSDFNLAVCEFIGSYVYLKLGDVNKTLLLLNHSLKIAEKVGAKNLICQCCWMLSNMNLHFNNKESAIQYAKKCFALAREGNYLQIFVSYYETSSPLLKLAIEEGIEEEFIEKIIIRLDNKSHQLLSELLMNNNKKARNKANYLLQKLNSKNVATSSEVLDNYIDFQDNIMLLHCFGVFDIYWNNEPTLVQWKTTKAKELLAYLGKHNGNIVSKEKILEDIWPEMNPENTSKWLHTYIYQIRKVLQTFEIQKGIAYNNSGYKIASKQIKSDNIEFELLINKSRNTNNDDEIIYLEQATSLYTGEYLEGYYTEWILHERQRLEQKYLKALERLSILYIQHKKYNQALDSLNTILRIDPLLEKANELLMIVYEKMDNRILAIQQYETFHQIIKTELGIEPKKEMQDLYYRLLEEK